MDVSTDLELRLRQEMALYSRRSFTRGLVSGIDGNLSVRLPGTDTVLITPSGVSLEEIEPELNLLLDLEGRILKPVPGLNPSKESSFHLAAYRLRPEVHGLAHVHPPYSTAYANKGKDLPLVTVSARTHLKHVPCIDCAPPGSPELCDLVCAALKGDSAPRAMLMKEHGILTLGRDLKEAYFLADLVEETAKVAFIETSLRG